MINVELSIRDAIRLNELLRNSMEILRYVDDSNYPMRSEDYALLEKLRIACDAYWNK